jgi:microcompartment protein CcmL/EutN
MSRSLALLEIGYIAPALVVADRCLKSAGVSLIGVENTDAMTVCLKFSGGSAEVREAAAMGEEIARRMKTSILASVLPAPEHETTGLVKAAPLFSPLLNVYDGWAPKGDSSSMSTAFKAIGLLETQGLVVNLHAVDVMLKTSDVRVVGKEKLGGGYITVLLEGDLAAVQAAIEAGRRTVEQLGGKLILADVIANPHPDLAALLPK